MCAVSTNVSVDIQLHSLYKGTILSECMCSLCQPQATHGLLCSLYCLHLANSSNFERYALIYFYSGCLPLEQ